MENQDRTYQQACNSTDHISASESVKVIKSSGNGEATKDNSIGISRSTVEARYKPGWRPEHDPKVQQIANTLGLSTSHISPLGPANHSDYKCVVSIGGNKVSVKGHKPNYIKKGGGHRGEVKGFSKNSRRRMMRLVGSIDREALQDMPIFITLTYPGDWPHDPKVWKKHRDNWSKRLLRQYPKASAIWKLEPQKRGAPHYHIIVLNVPHVSKDWLAESWYEVVASGDEKHLRAGTRVEAMREWNGCVYYAAKYSAKVVEELPKEWQRVGRMWGVIGRHNLPITNVSFSINKASFLKIRGLLSFYNGGPPPGWTQYENDGLTAMVDWEELL